MRNRLLLLSVIGCILVVGSDIVAGTPARYMYGLQGMVDADSVVHLIYRVHLTDSVEVDSGLFMPSYEEPLYMYTPSTHSRWELDQSFYTWYGYGSGYGETITQVVVFPDALDQYVMSRTHCGIDCDMVLYSEDTAVWSATFEVPRHLSLLRDHPRTVYSSFATAPLTMISRDAGRTWPAMGAIRAGTVADSLLLPFAVFAVSPWSDSVLFGVDSLEAIVRSTDGGQTTTQTALTAPFRTEVAMQFGADDSTAYLTKRTYRNTQFFRSMQRGQPASWTAIMDTTIGAQLAVDPTRPQHLFLGMGHTSHHSTDGGSTWQSWHTLLDSITGLYHPPGSEPLYVTTVGALLRISGTLHVDTLDHTPVNIAGEPAPLPPTVQLLQNYPNPWNGQTTIQYYLPHAGRVQLTLYNLRGERVAALVDARHHPGWHTATVQVPDLASGVYLYRLTTRSHTQTKSMIVLQ